MKFFRGALVHIILAASTAAAIKSKEVKDDSKRSRTLRGSQSANTRRSRALKGSKSSSGGYDYDPWYPEPDPWYPEADPWYPEPDPWYSGSDDYAESDPYYPEPDPYYPEPDPYYPEPDPWEGGYHYPAPEPYYPDHDPYAPKKKPKKGKIKEYILKKKAKGSKSKGGSGSGGGGHYPPHRPVHPVYPVPPIHPEVPPHHHPETCKYYKIRLEAFQAPAQAVVPEDGVNELGTIFIYNSPLFLNPDLTIPVEGPDGTMGAFVTGTCTRIQQRRDIANSTNVVAGAGSCTWTYTINLEGLSGTFDVAGELFDSVRSTMAVTGGSDSFIGVAGQAEYIPSPEGTDQDIFTGVDYYQAAALLFLKDCDPSHYKWWHNHRGVWDWNGGHGNGGYGHGY